MFKSSGGATWLSHVLAACLLAGIVAGRLYAGEKDPTRLSARLSVRTNSPKVGDKILIDFTVTNEGAADYTYLDWSGLTQWRDGDCRLVARNEWGEIARDPESRQSSSPMSTGPVAAPVAARVLPPKGTFTRTVALNKWALITAEGCYTVEGIYTPKGIPSDAVAVTVAPRSRGEMGKYIDGLAAELRAIRPPEKRSGGFGSALEPGGDARMSLKSRLAYTCEARIIPILLETLYKPDGGSVESKAFLNYLPRNEATRMELLETGRRRGLAEGMQWTLEAYMCTPEDMYPLIERSLAPDNPGAWEDGARAAQRYARDDFMPRLIAIAAGAGNPGRTQAIYAIAFNRTDEGVRTLKAVLEDKDKQIAERTRDAVRAAYLYRGNTTGRRMRDDDFDESFRKPIEDK